MRVYGVTLEVEIRKRFTSHMFFLMFHKFVSNPLLIFCLLVSVHLAAFGKCVSKHYSLTYHSSISISTDTSLIQKVSLKLFQRMNFTLTLKLTWLGENIFQSWNQNVPNFDESVLCNLRGEYQENVISHMLFNIFIKSPLNLLPCSECTFSSLKKK